MEKIAFIDPFDYIAGINKCTQIVRKVCLCGNEIDSTAMDILKEARYEILHVILNIQKLEENESSLKSRKDEIERKIFHIDYETKLDNIKINNLREEWRIQQKHMAEIQKVLQQKIRQVELYSSYLTTQGSALSGLLVKLLRNADVTDFILENKDFVSFTEIVSEYLQSFAKSYVHRKPLSDSTEYKYCLAVCDCTLAIANNEHGRKKLLNNAVCQVIVKTMVEVIPKIAISNGDNIKISMVKTLQNLAIEKEGSQLLQNIKDTTTIIEELNHIRNMYFAQEIVTFFVILTNYIERDSEEFFKTMKERISKEYFSKICDNQVRNDLHKIQRNIERAEAFFSELKKCPDEMLYYKKEDKEYSIPKKQEKGKRRREKKKRQRKQQTEAPKSGICPFLKYYISQQVPSASVASKAVPTQNSLQSGKSKNSSTVSCKVSVTKAKSETSYNPEGKCSTTISLRVTSKSDTELKSTVSSQNNDSTRCLCKLAESENKIESVHPDDTYIPPVDELENEDKSIKVGKIASVKAAAGMLYPTEGSVVHQKITTRFKLPEFKQILDEPFQPVKYTLALKKDAE